MYVYFNILLCSQDLSIHMHNIIDISTSSYHPQGNGQVEHYNQILKAMLAKEVSDHQHDWDSSLPRVLLAYNSYP